MSGSGRRVAIGVDVGGTKIALAVVPEGVAEPVAEEILPTRREAGGADVLARVVAATKRVASRARAAGYQLTGIGVGVPEVVDAAGRIISGGVLPDWRSLPVAESLAEIAPVWIEADVRAAALAEQVFGHGRTHQTFCYITVGTGISYCLCWNGSLLLGRHGAAINLGTTLLADIQRAGDGRFTYVLEDVASGTGIVRRYRELGGHADGAQTVLAAADAGENTAREVTREAGRQLGLGIALIVNLLNPDAVIVGGGLGSAQTAYWQTARDWAQRYIQIDAVKETPLLQSALGARTGLIGAALHVFGRATQPREEHVSDGRAGERSRSMLATLRAPCPVRAQGHGTRDAASEGSPGKKEKPE